MNSSSNGYNFRAALSAVFAAAIVGTSGLALDKGHAGGAAAGLDRNRPPHPGGRPAAGRGTAGGHRQCPPPGDGRPAGEGLTMRHIFHEILARYLDERTARVRHQPPRELWPESAALVAPPGVAGHPAARPRNVAVTNGSTVSLNPIIDPIERRPAPGIVTLRPAVPADLTPPAPLGQGSRRPQLPRRQRLALGHGAPQASGLARMAHRRGRRPSDRLHPDHRPGARGVAVLGLHEGRPSGHRHLDRRTRRP